MLSNSVRIFWQDLCRPSDLYACYRLLFLITFVAGVNPLEFRSLPKRHLQSSFLSYFNVIGHIGFYIYIFIYMKTYGKSMMNHLKESDVSRFTDNMRKFNGTVAILLVFCLCLLQSKSLTKLLERYELLELRLVRLGIAFLHKNCAFWINTTVVGMLCANFGFVLYGSVVVFSSNGISVSFLTSISFYSPHLIVSSVAALFSALMQALSQYLKALNKVMIIFHLFIPSPLGGDGIYHFLPSKL